MCFFEGSRGVVFLFFLFNFCGFFGVFCADRALLVNPFLFFLKKSGNFPKTGLKKPCVFGKGENGRCRLV